MPGLLERKDRQDQFQAKSRRHELPVHSKRGGRWLPPDVRRRELPKVQPPAGCLWIRHLRARHCRQGKRKYACELRKLLLFDGKQRGRGAAAAAAGQRNREHQENGMPGNQRPLQPVHDGTRRIDEGGRFQGLLRVPGHLGGRQLHASLHHLRRVRVLRVGRQRGRKRRGHLRDGLVWTNDQSIRYRDQRLPELCLRDGRRQRAESRGQPQRQPVFRHRERREMLQVQHLAVRQ
mmetsp:Transcript_12771/g.29872  ORF Transcript_12771/g.29872 Transcript_12771/m.29872 type:complete len:234 (+) Transcript_12771:1284-1985(+)